MCALLHFVITVFTKRDDPQKCVSCIQRTFEPSLTPIPTPLLDLAIVVKNKAGTHLRIFDKK
jgi:hypothetical protein